GPQIEREAQGTRVCGRPGRDDDARSLRPIDESDEENAAERGSNEIRTVHTVDARREPSEREAGDDAAEDERNRYDHAREHDGLQTRKRHPWLDGDEKLRDEAHGNGHRE